MDTAQTDDPLARRFIDALHALERDGPDAVDAMAALFGDEATIANAALDLAGAERTGVAGVRAFWTDYCHSLAGASTSFHAVTASATAVGLFWTTGLANAPGGAPSEYPGATLLSRAAGSDRIDAMRGYYDTRALSTKSPA